MTFGWARRFVLCCPRSPALYVSKEQFIGTWKLISLEFVGSDGEVTYPCGKDAVGIHTWNETGHFATQVGRVGRPSFAVNDLFGAAPEEAISAINRYGAYFGTYAVDENQSTVTHTPIAARWKCSCFSPHRLNTSHRTPPYPYSFLIRPPMHLRVEKPWQYPPLWR